MYDFESPFLTFTNAACELGYMGEAAELAALHRRTEALDYALRNGKEFDVVLDMLAEDGQDPLEYVEQVGQNVEFIIANDIIPDGLDIWQRHLDL